LLINDYAPITRHQIVRTFRNRIFCAVTLARGRAHRRPGTCSRIAGHQSVAWEREVLVAARPGATVSEIAGKLFLSVGTLRNYLFAAIVSPGVVMASAPCAGPYWTAVPISNLESSP
jgi:hypothetical protein